jgi:hypothetical protein
LTERDAQADLINAEAAKIVTDLSDTQGLTTGDMVNVLTGALWMVYENMLRRYDEDNVQGDAQLSVTNGSRPSVSFSAPQLRAMRTWAFGFEPGISRS